MGSSHLLQQNIKQKDEKVSALNQVIQEREEKLAELENKSGRRKNLYFLLYVEVNHGFSRLFVTDTGTTIALDYRSRGPVS